MLEQIGYEAGRRQLARAPVKSKGATSPALCLQIKCSKQNRYGKCCRRPIHRSGLAVRGQKANKHDDDDGTQAVRARSKKNTTTMTMGRFASLALSAQTVEHAWNNKKKHYKERTNRKHTTRRRSQDDDDAATTVLDVAGGVVVIIVAVPSWRDTHGML